MRKHALFLLFATLATSAQGLELSITQAARAVILLHEVRPGNKQFVGSGFLVQLPDALFLVTAEHVAKGLGSSAMCTVGGDHDEVIPTPLAELAGSPSPAWVFHGVADVAVLHLRGTVPILDRLRSRALQPEHLISAIEAPARDRPLTVIGFPLGFGGLILGPDQRVSPISRESHAVSGLVTFGRFDTKKPANFYLLDNPSIGGFSGAPVFMLPAAFINDQSIGFGPPVGFCVGIVHGTVNDDTGGKLAAITPVAYVAQTLERAFASRTP